MPMGTAATCHHSYIAVAVQESSKSLKKPPKCFYLGIQQATARLRMLATLPLAELHCPAASPSKLVRTKLSN